MKVPLKLLTGANSTKIAFHKRANKGKDETVDLNINEFFKATTVAYIRDNHCLPTIRFKQELDLGLVTKGKEQGSGFSVACYYENSDGMKIPVGEFYGESIISALIQAHGQMPFPASVTASNYTPENSYYPYTEDIMRNLEKHLLADKDRRISLAPDIAKINGMTNMVMSLSTIDNHALSGSYDPSNFHVICLGSTNPIEAIQIANEILPQIEQFRANDPTCFVTDTSPFDFSAKESCLSKINNKMKKYVNPRKASEYVQPVYEYMPEEYDIQGELAALEKLKEKGLFDTNVETFALTPTLTEESVEAAEIAEDELLKSGFSLVSTPLAADVSQGEDGGQPL